MRVEIYHLIFIYTIENNCIKNRFKKPDISQIVNLAPSPISPSSHRVIHHYQKYRQISKGTHQISRDRVEDVSLN